jgi:hypothetical protein
MMIGTQSQPDLVLVALGRAMLCLDCEIISNCKGDECPACRGHSLLSLTKILGGSLKVGQDGSPKAA